MILQFGPSLGGSTFDNGINTTSNLSVLNSIREVTGIITFQFVENNTPTALETIDIFSCLETVGANSGFGGYFLDGHDDLEEAPVFDKLLVAGALGIVDTPNLPNFGSLTTVNRGVGIINA